MATDEVNKTKRIRHCYPRKEIYHRWIHSPEYVYTPHKGIRCAGAGDYLKIGDFYSAKTNEDIKAQWWIDRQYIIAIIDRNNKRIIINTRYNDHRLCLLSAIPNDFEIFETNEIINNPDILKNDEELFKLQAKYYIKQRINSLIPCYGIIKNIGSRQLYYDIDNKEYIEHSNKVLKDFIKKHKLKNYDWYKESLEKDYKINININIYRSVTIKIDLPSIKQIINNTIFTPKEKLILRQHYFYTKYCYGNGISLKFIKDNWNKVPIRTEAIKYFERTPNFRNASLWIELDNKLTWNELIIKHNEIFYKYIEATKKRYEVESKENERKARELLNSKDDLLTDWRNNKHNITSNKITYRHFVKSYRKKEIGTWINKTLDNVSYFNNTQLRLIDNKQKVQTSKGACVNLNEAINLFKYLQKYINNSNINCETFNNIKVGIYNLRYIKLTTKFTDDGRNLDRKEWLIQIGCHSLWLDDILDFIHYYKLEKEFGLVENNVKLKLKL